MTSMITLGIVCCVIGLVVNVGHMLLGLHSTHWRPVDCVVDLSIVNVPTLRPPSKLPTISARFTYTVDNREYSGWRIAYCQRGINQFSDTISERYLLQLQLGEHVQLTTVAYAWVWSPRFSVLQPGLSSLGIAESLLRGTTIIIIAWSLWNSMSSS